MKTNKLVEVIRKIIREEVKSEVKKILTEQTTEQTTALESYIPESVPTRKNSKKSVKYTDNVILNEVLNNTEAEEEYPTMNTFNASDARAGFAGMQDGTQQTVQQDINGRPVDMSEVDESVSNAITRDYSELVKKFKK